MQKEKITVKEKNASLMPNDEEKKNYDLQLN